MAESTITKANALDSLQSQGERNPIHTLYDQLQDGGVIATRVTDAQADLDTLPPSVITGGWGQLNWNWYWTHSTVSYATGAAWKPIGDAESSAVSAEFTADTTNGKLTLNTNDARGHYFIVFHSTFSLAKSIGWQWALCVSGTNIVDSVYPQSGYATYGATGIGPDRDGLRFSGVGHLSSGDYVDLRVRHNSVSNQVQRPMTGILLLYQISDSATP